MKSQDLRSSILQYAMEGKLVPQDSNEESANILLDEIIKEKELLIEKKIIKREKALPKIEKDEIPFKIPTSWEWVRLKDVIYNYGQKKPTEDFCYIDVASIDNTIGSLKENIEILNPENAPSRARKIVKKGSILYSTVRPYLQNICIIDKDFAKEAIASTAFLVMNPIKILDKYLYYTVKSPFFNDYVESKMVGVAYPAINDRNLNSAVIPIPPLSEQERIVEKVEELFQRVDQYNVLEEKISSLNENFPVDMEKSILQYAMQGSLTTRRSTDEPVRILIEKINEEKDKLLKQKLIRKINKLPISEFEIPFELPQSWEWVRMQQVLDVRDGTHDTPAYTKEGIPLITSKNLKNGSIDYSNIKYISEEDHKKIIKRSKVDKGDILFAMIGSIGNPVLISEDEDFSIKNVALFKQYPSRILDMKYIYYVLKYLEDDFKSNASGGVQSFISLTNLRNTPIPIAPIEEQKRIVRKIEELLSQTEKLHRIKQ